MLIVLRGVYHILVWVDPFSLCSNVIRVVYIVSPSPINTGQVCNPKVKLAPRMRSYQFQTENALLTFKL